MKAIRLSKACRALGITVEKFNELTETNFNQNAKIGEVDYLGINEMNQNQLKSLEYELKKEIKKRELRLSIEELTKELSELEKQ